MAPMLRSAAARLLCGPLGHLVAGAVDWAVLLGSSLARRGPMTGRTASVPESSPQHAPTEPADQPP